MSTTAPHSSPVLREELVAFKRERILEEAIALFYARGFTATTLDDVAAALGVTKPFIYTYFRSKTDLLAAICRPTMELSVAAIARAAAAPGCPRARLRMGVIDFAKVVLGRQANIAIFFREEKSLEPADLAEITGLRKVFDRELSNLLAEGVAAGAFHLKDVSLAALAIGGMISWAYTWHRAGGRLALDDLCAELADFALAIAGVTDPPPAAKAALSSP